MPTVLPSAPTLQAKAYVAEIPPSKTLDTLAHVSSPGLDTLSLRAVWEEICSGALPRSCSHPCPGQQRLFSPATVLCRCPAARSCASAASAPSKARTTPALATHPGTCPWARQCEWQCMLLCTLGHEVAAACMPLFPMIACLLFLNIISSHPTPPSSCSPAAASFSPSCASTSTPRRAPPRRCTSGSCPATPMWCVPPARRAAHAAPTSPRHKR